MVKATESPQKVGIENVANKMKTKLGHGKKMLVHHTRNDLID